MPDLPRAQTDISPSGVQRSGVLHALTAAWIAADSQGYPAGTNMDNEERGGGRDILNVHAEEIGQQHTDISR